MRSIFSLIVIIALLIIVGVFSFQNTLSLDLRFFHWSWQTSSGLMTLIALLVGIFIGIVWFLPGVIYHNFTIMNLRSRIDKLEKGLGKTENDLTEKTTTVEKLEKKIDEESRKNILMEGFLQQ